MTTANNLKNQNPEGLGNLGQITLRQDLITVENLECWIESATQDANTSANANDREYYKGQIFAYDHILDVLRNGF